MRPWGATAAVALAVIAGAARAETLADFVAAARARSAEVREQAALVERARARAAAAGRTLLPSLSLTGRYTRNQREVTAQIPSGRAGTLEDVTFVPVDALEATAQVDAELFDLGAWRQLDAAEAQARQARLEARAVADDVTRVAARSWFDHLAAWALRRSAVAMLEAATATRRVVGARLDAGLATQLDVERAEAEVARARQAVAEAEAAIADAARDLRTLTGLSPSASSPPPAEAELLAPVPPLASWLEAVESLPSVRAASEAAEASRAEAAAAGAAWIPTLGGQARESYTNAAGFGEPLNWAVGVTATWRLDPADPARAQAAAAQALAAVRRAERARRDARAAIEAAWDAVRASRARAEAATVEDEAAGRAVAIARAEYPERASLLDVVLLERDAFRARAARVRALADLAYARAELLVAAGRGEELAL